MALAILRRDGLPTALGPADTLVCRGGLAVEGGAGGTDQRSRGGGGSAPCSHGRVGRSLSGCPAVGRRRVVVSTVSCSRPLGSKEAPGRAVKRKATATAVQRGAILLSKDLLHIRGFTVVTLLWLRRNGLVGVCPSPPRPPKSELK